MEPIPSKFQEEMNDLRALFFIEAHPFSNRYFQLRFTNEQYKAILALMESFCPHKEDGSFTARVSEDEYTLPDLKDFYEKA